MTSVHTAPAQRLTKTFVISSGAALYIYSLTDLTTQLAAVSAAQLGSLFVAPTTAAIITAFAAATPTNPTAPSLTLTDLGKDVVVQATGTDAYVALREVKYSNTPATGAFTTGFVVVENNWNLVSGTRMRVAVARV